MKDNAKAKYVEPLLFVAFMMLFTIAMCYFRVKELTTDLDKAKDIITKKLTVRDTVYKFTSRYTEIPDYGNIEVDDCVKKKSKELVLHDNINCEHIFYERPDVGHSGWNR